MQNSCTQKFIPLLVSVENAVLILYGQNEKGDILEGPPLAAQLRQKIHQDDGLLQFRLVSVDTVLCLDHCSGHGVCQDLPSGRECLCDAFWMENFLKRKYGNGERNCGRDNITYMSKTVTDTNYNLLMNIDFHRLE